MSNERSPTQYMGVRAIAPPDLTLAKISPPANFKPVVKGQLYLDTVAETTYMWSGTTWIVLGSGTTGAIVTLTGDSGGAISPVAGNIDILGGAGVSVVGTAGTLTISLTGGGLAIDSFVPDAGTNPVVPSALGVVTMAGTANQITTTGGLNSLTFSVPAAFIAPGSIASTTTITSGTALVATTTMTAGTGITSTLGNIVASAGNITATLGSVAAATTVTAGTGITATTGNIVASTGNITSTLGSVAAATTVTAGTSITATLGAITATNGNFVRGTAGNKDVYSSVASTTTAGANSAGRVTLAGGTATISTTAVTASSLIRLTRQSVGSTGANDLGILSVGAIVAATSFEINAWTVTNATALQADDVSEIFWEIVN